jgi:hypothetical protein
MIERYTIKFAPAVSQKKLEKLLTEGEAKVNPADFHKLKTRIEFVGDFDDIRKLKEALKGLSKP